MIYAVIHCYVSCLGDSVQYGGSGVIYALSQYSPFISIPRYTPNSQVQSIPFSEDDNSNLGIEDAESKSTSQASSRVSPSTQDQTLCNEPGEVCFPLNASGNVYL